MSIESTIRGRGAKKNIPIIIGYTKLILKLAKLKGLRGHPFSESLREVIRDYGLEYKRRFKK